MEPLSERHDRWRVVYYAPSMLIVGIVVGPLDRAAPHRVVLVLVLLVVVVTTAVP